MTDRHALDHLRQARLTTVEIKTIGLLVQRGGEIDWFPLVVKPLTNQCIDGMISKQLVCLLDARTRLVITKTLAASASSIVAEHGSHVRLRLTDQGRAVAAQLEAMEMRPKLEVPSAS